MVKKIAQKMTMENIQLWSNSWSWTNIGWKQKISCKEIIGQFEGQWKILVFTPKFTLGLLNHYLQRIFQR